MCICIYIHIYIYIGVTKVGSMGWSCIKICLLFVLRISCLSLPALPLPRKLEILVRPASLLQYRNNTF